MAIQAAHEWPASPNGTAPAPGESIVVHVDADLGELIDEYLEHRQADARALPVELAAGDYPSIWRRGHNMKGVGSPYGFDYITELGAELEAAAGSRDEAAVRRCGGALADYLARVEVRPAPEL